MTQKTDHETRFISRWSHRKLDEKTTTEQTAIAEVSDISEPLAPDEPTVQAAQPIWQQADVDRETKKKALKALFRQPEFNQVDRMNEYDEDFTQFKGLGDVITHQMKRMLKLAQQSITEQQQTLDKPQDSPSQTVDMDGHSIQPHNEDNKIV